MAEHPNAVAIHKSFDAFARGEMATMRLLVPEDTVWHIPGRGPLAGDHYGRDAVFEMFGRSVEGSQGTFTQELHDVVASEEHAGAFTHATASRDDHKSAYTGSNCAQSLHVGRAQSTSYSMAMPSVRPTVWPTGQPIQAPNARPGCKRVR